MPNLNSAVIYGSVRSERKGIYAAKFIVRKLQDRGHDVTLVDAADHDLPMLDRMHKEFDAGAAPSNMRGILAELGSPAIPSAMPVSKIQSAFDDEGNALDERYEKSVVRFLDEYEWYARALQAERMRERCGVESPTQQQLCRG
jgi:NAD(P)H-dependent FMN reductase